MQKNASSPRGGDADKDQVTSALRAIERPLYVERHGGGVRLTRTMSRPEALLGMVPAVPIASLGAQSFKDAHAVRYAYVSGAMAGGISSVALVVAMGKAGMLGFFGSGGLALERVRDAICEVQRSLAADPYGFNLLHNYFEPAREMQTVELYLAHQVRCVEAAAYMDLTPAVVYFRAHGLRRLPDGRVVAKNRIFAKVSRPEVGRCFMAPPPASILRELLDAGRISKQEAELASELPVAEDITAEADSGGHTDQRPMPVLLPLFLHEREQAMKRYDYQARGAQLRIGVGGGIGDPLSAFAALALGADYLQTGSINQGCREAATSEAVKTLLADADMADVVMAPAPDMFELGARVQVLRRGTMFAQRAQRLFELYRTYASFEDVPAQEREKVERQILQRPFAEVWAETERYWRERDPAKAEEGTKDQKARMALCFRWYLGCSSRWASSGQEGRQADYQIWCGPAMGAFNRWVASTWLMPLLARSAPVVGISILSGAAALIRREAALRLGVLELPSLIDVCAPYERQELPLAASLAA